MFVNKINSNKNNELISHIENLIIQLDSDFSDEDEKLSILFELEVCLDNLVEFNKPLRKSIKINSSNFDFF